MKILLSAADVLKVMGHPVRLQIVEILEKIEEMPVFELQRELQLSQVATSQHLCKMRALGLVGSRRYGGAVFYHLKQVPMMRSILQTVRLLAEQ